MSDDRHGEGAFSRARKEHIDTELKVDTSMEREKRRTDAVLHSERNLQGDCAVCGEQSFHATTCATLVRRLKNAGISGSVGADHISADVWHPRHTHTTAGLAVSAETFDEIATKLRAADYHHALHRNSDTIDMSGISLVREPSREPRIIPATDGGADFLEVGKMPRLVGDLIVQGIVGDTAVERTYRAPVNAGGSGVNARQVGGVHYGLTQFQHWDMVALFQLDYFQGQVTKYIMRWREKNGIEDLEKAQHYLEKYIEIEKNRTINAGPRFTEELPDSPARIG